MQNKQEAQYASTKCTSKVFTFPTLNRKRVEASFSGGDLSSDGGVLLLEQVDRSLELTQQLAAILPDARDPSRITHTQQTLLSQLVYGICCGYEDLNDQDHLRHDPLWQTAMRYEEPLGSASSLCRLENRADRKAAYRMHEVLLDVFVKSFTQAPKELILDFDATDDRVHGEQENRFYHGYYRGYCFLPLYVFCKDQLLVSWLRPANGDAAGGSLAVLKRLVKRLRQAWPEVKILMRGDGGFCRWKTMQWCEDNEVEYLFGIGKNKRISRCGKALLEEAATAFEKTQQKQRFFGEFNYQADSWDRSRRVIQKAEHTEKGANPRYVVTNLSGDAQHIYDEIYCARGEMENRIKEQQLGLFADRTSAHGWWANQMRLLLSSCAYILLETIRRVGLVGSEMARSQVNTIRLKLLKIGAAVISNTRRIRILMSQTYPYVKIYEKVYRSFCPG